MTLETLGASQTLTTAKNAGCKSQASQENLVHELCMPLEWFQMYKGRLDKMRLYKQHKYHNDDAYRNTVIHPTMLAQK